MTVADLFSPDDPDWADYQEQSPEFFLRVAGSAIRNYLGWHLAPNVEQTTRTKVGSKGIVMLPSRHVTEVASVTMWGKVLPDTEYWWSEEGFLELRCYCQDEEVDVIFSHGYDEPPDDVKMVAYELVDTAKTTVPTGGNVAALSSPGGYRVQFRDSTGLGSDGFQLNDEQRYRLANYRIFGVA